MYVPTVSAGSIRSDWPMPYQLCSFPPRPCVPNSGNSSGKTGGSEVQRACVDCRRWVVSAEPSSPDCTTNAMSPAVKASRNIGPRKRRLRFNRSIIACYFGLSTACDSNDFARKLMETLKLNGDSLIIVWIDLLASKQITTVLVTECNPHRM